MEPREEREIISCKTVAKTMRKLGLVGARSKRWETTAILDRTDAYPVDVVLAKWDVGAFNQVWDGDISYLRTWEGRLNLATVIDAHSRRMIGWAGVERMRTDLVEDALSMAITLRSERPEKVIFHTDRGTQYASDRITTFANENRPVRSMSYTGVCWDNAMAERCFATSKTEFHY